MGMLYHSIGLIVTFQNGHIMENDFGFDNEEIVALSNKNGLFQNIKTAEDFREYFFAAFNTQYDDCSLEELMEDLSDIDYFEDMMQDLEDCDFYDLKDIVIWTDQECHGYREYCWQKFSFSPYSVTNGTYQTPKIERKGPYEPSATKYIKENVLQLSKEKNTVGEVTPQKPSEKAQLTFETFGLDFEYIVREKDMTLFGTTYPRGVIIKGYKGTQKKLVIPDEVEDYPVVHIGSLGVNDYVEEVVFDQEKIGFSDDAFKDCAKMVTHDENGNKIMFGVLLECKNIQSTMVLPGAQKIANRLFQNNDVIENVVVAEGTEIIDNCAFENCKNLRSVRFPKTLKRIGASAFSGCIMLTDVVFPDNLEEISSSAFKDCKSIRSASFPQSLNKIGWHAFENCAALEKVSIHPGTTCESGAFSIRNSKLIGADGLAVVNGVLFDFNYFLHSKHIGSANGQIDIVIPAEVKQIGGNTCFDAPGEVIDTFTITDITRVIDAGDFFVAGINKFRILDHVTGDLLFETSAFANCPNLVSDSERFEKMCELIESGDFTALQKKFGDKKKSTTPKVERANPQTPTNISDKSKQNSQRAEEAKATLDAVKTAWIQKYEQHLDRSAQISFSGKLFVFAGFGEEKNNPMVQQVLERGGELRAKISGLTNYLVVNPTFAGDAKIKSALEQREKGKNIKIVLIEDLEKALKVNQTAQTAQTATKPNTEKTSESVKLVETVTATDAEIEFRIHGQKLERYEGKETIVFVPDGITSIADYAFCGLKVSNVFLPDSLTEIGSAAFADCEELLSIKIPNGVKSVGDSAFARCKSLMRVVWPGSAQKIPHSAFSKCESLMEVVIEDGVTEIAQWAFAFCTNLQKLVIPASVNQIDLYMLLATGGVTTIHAYLGSCGERFAKDHNLPLQTMLTPEQEAERKRQQEEAERRRKAAEEAERYRLAVLAEKRKRYDQITKQIADQNQIVSANRGWFGVQAKNRKAALQQIEMLQSLLAREFPNGRP